MTGARAPEDGFDSHSATNRACAIPGQATHYPCAALCGYANRC